jgi:hypothetical protein
MTEKSSATLPGRVEKVIKPIHPSQPEKAQISVDGADHLYREIRIENKRTDENGNEVKLRPGATVDVTVEAEPKDTRGSRLCEEFSLSSLQIPRSFLSRERDCERL